MRLRTRLALAFSLLALLPAGVIGVVTLRTVTADFEDVFERRLEGTERAARVEVGRAGDEVRETVDALATRSPTVEEVARALWRGDADLPSLVPLARGLMAGLDLQVLFLLDDDGRVLSSGHLPARFGDREAALLALSREHPDTPELRWVEVRREDRIERDLALLVARPVGGTYGGGLHLVGGRVLGQDFVDRVGRLTGSTVALTAVDGSVLATSAPAAPVPRAARLPFGLGAGARSRIVRLGEPPLAELAVSVSDAPLARARGHILLVLLASSVLAVLAALLVGGLLASRITRPVDALAGAARRIGRGDYETRVEVPASGELAHLVTAFNTMGGEIRAARERISAAERVAAWQEIARRLAHEIKNPLMPISTSIETLRRTWTRRHPQFEEIFDESTTAILEEVQALRRIVDEFSRFARLPAPDRTAVAPAELVEGTLALFPEPPDGIALLREVPDGLPDLLVDREQLQQVLLNLVTNAVQAIQGAGGRGTVRVRAGRRDDEGWIEVEDDGPGIPAASRGELFTPYFTTKESGTGLGLAICHRIVAEHGGRIEVRSEEGAGATFRLLLPLAGEPAEVA